MEVIDASEQIPGSFVRVPLDPRSVGMGHLLLLSSQERQLLGTGIRVYLSTVVYYVA